jgi:murein DD-endopeptidase MepM/ murein hydrolase activator NlpD
MKLRALESTVFKKKPVQSSTLADNEKFAISANAEYDLKDCGDGGMNHFQITLLNSPKPGEDSWFVYMPHVLLLDDKGERIVAQRPAAAAVPAASAAPASDGAWSWPMKGTSCGAACEFGYARGRLHAGIDIGGFTPDECHAASDGVVTQVKNDTSGAEGRAIYIKRSDGWQHVYYHLQSISVQPGQAVKRGQLIAVRGGSGFGFEGREIDGGGYSIHLHFEIRQPDGTPVDPRSILPDDGSNPIVG